MSVFPSSFVRINSYRNATIAQRFSIVITTPSAAQKVDCMEDRYACVMTTSEIKYRESRYLWMLRGECSRVASVDARVDVFSHSMAHDQQCSEDECRITNASSGLVSSDSQQKRR